MLLSIEYDREISLEGWNPGMYFWLMNPSRDEEIAASVGAHRDLGPAYDKLTMMSRRGLGACHNEWLLAATAHNLRKLHAHRLSA